MLRALLELSRVSNLPTVWTNVLAAWIIASGRDWAWTPALGWLLLGASLMYSAGMVLNDACDATWDREHRPERPIPSGRISLKTVWVIGLTWLLGGAAIMIFLGGANWLMTLLLLAAIVAYDLYHKPWAGSVIVMGACRTLLYLVAGSAVLATWDFSRLLTCYGVVLGLYIVALTLLARAEGKGNVKPAMRLLLTAGLLLPVGWTWLLQHSFCEGPDGLPAMASIPVAVSLCWTGWALLKMRQGGKSIGDAVGLLLAGIAIVDGLAISQFSPEVAVGFCVLPPLLRLWQRWIAAT